MQKQDLKTPPGDKPRQNPEPSDLTGNHPEETGRSGIKAPRKRPPAAAAAAAVVVLAVLILFRFLPSSKHMAPEEYFGISDENDVAVIINGELQETGGRLIDSASYLPYETVHSLINPSVYYDEGASSLIVTIPSEKRVYPIKDGRGLDGRAVTEDGQLYIAADYLVEIMGIDLHLYEEPNRQVVRTNGTYRVCTFKKNHPVRYRAGIKSPVIRDMEKGDEAWVLDLDEDGNELPSKVKGWVYVSTYNGYTGYVRENALEETGTETLDKEDPFGEWTAADPGLDGKVNMAFHQTDNTASNRALTEMLKGVEGVNVIAPTWFYLDSTSGDVKSVADETYVKEAHKAGLKVWAVLNDFDGNLGSADETSAFLHSYEARTAVIKTVTDAVKAVGADGINVDIELVRKTSADAFAEFLRELSVVCRNESLVLSVDTYVPLFTRYLNRSEQARVVDYIVTMCYDEHTGSSEEAGSVSSLPFVEKAIRQSLTEIPKEKLVIALPFYTRIWTTENGVLTECRTLGMTGAEKQAEELGMEPAWDEETGQYYGESKEGETLRQVWLEEERSLEEKMKLIRTEDCAGVAEWKLGMEKPDVWKVIQQYLA